MARFKVIYYGYSGRIYNVLKLSLWLLKKNLLSGQTVANILLDIDVILFKNKLGCL